MRCPPLSAVLIAGLAIGCSSLTPSPSSPAPAPTPTPVADDASVAAAAQRTQGPVLEFECTILEGPEKSLMAPFGIDERSEALVVPVTGSTGGSATSFPIDLVELAAAIDELRATPGVRIISTPIMSTLSGYPADVQMGMPSSFEQHIRLAGTVAGKDLALEVSMATYHGNQCAEMQRAHLRLRQGEGSATLFAPSADGEGRASLLLVRPTVVSDVASFRR